MAQTVLKELLDGRTKNLTGFPSEYGSTNASEFFAEVFAGYCLWKTDHGRKAFSLIEPVFAKFIDVTRVRSGLHESLEDRRIAVVVCGDNRIRESIPGTVCVKKPIDWIRENDGWEAGVLTVKNPLYIESTKGWADRLAERYGRAGMALSAFLRKQGHDAILVETSSGAISTVVVLNNDAISMMPFHV